MQMIDRHIAAVAPWLVVLATLLAPSAAHAQTDIPVDVELVIAVDVSMSMDQEEQTIQREGYVRAFLDPMVLSAIEQGIHGQVAVVYVEWAGSAVQQVTVDWTLIDGASAAAEFSSTLAEIPISRARRTSISGAIDFSARLFGSNGYQGLRRVIDVSGDGPNNQGRLVTLARDEAVAQGITINGLPFVQRPGGQLSLFDIPYLDDYYVDCVIGGPGAFSLPVYSPAEFPEAIRNKLVLEIAGTASPVVPVQSRAPRMACDAGERQWNRFIGTDR